MTGVIQPQWRRTDELATRARQARRRATKRCILADSHGRAVKGGRCRPCYQKMLAAKRVGSRGRALTGAAYERVRAAVVARLSPHQRMDTPLVAARTEAGLRRWYDVPDVNARPRGWTVEEDRREELIALGELAVMRAVG